MANLISKIKLPNNVTYDIKDKVSTFGGTNFLIDSKNLSSFVTSTTTITLTNNIITLPGNASGWDYVHTPFISFDDLNGYTLTLSFEYKASVASDTWVVTEGTTSNTPKTGRTKYKDHRFTLAAKNTWTKYTQTFNNFSLAYLTSGSGDVNYFRIAFYSRTDGANLQIRYPKLERSNKPTDWTPAPEDLATYSNETIEFFQ